MLQRKKPIVSAKSKYHMPIMVELHSSLWLDDMRNYKVVDFMAEGVVCETPDILKGDPEIIERLKRVLWNVIPIPKEFVNKGYGCPNFIYLADSDDGLYIWHHEPLR
jgi:hypothetical protein